MPKIIITDILYTSTDETFYVLNRTHSNANKYVSKTLDETFTKLKADGWSKCGKVKRSNDLSVDMLSNSNGDYIAVWEEHSSA